MKPAGAPMEGEHGRKGETRFPAPRIRANPLPTQPLGLLATTALAYARRGLPVLPVRPRGKAPLCDHGGRDATIDRATVVRWWRR